MMKKYLTFMAFAAFALSMIATARADGPIDTFEPWPKLVTKVPNGTVNFCAGIEFVYGERVEAQGFLGLATPSAHIENVQHAVDYNTFLAWKSVAARNETGEKGVGKWSYDEYQRAVPHELRPTGGVLGVLGFDFRLSALCNIAKARKIKRLTFACDADKAVSEDSLGETTNERLVAECFISTFQGKKPSWNDLKNSKMGTAFSNKETYTGADSALDSDEGRTLAYVPLIKWAVDSIVGQEADRQRAAAARHALDVAHCPQPESLPISPSTFPINIK